MVHWKPQADKYGDQLYAEKAKAAGRNVAEDDLDEGAMRRMADCLAVSAMEIDGFIHRAAFAFAHHQDDGWLIMIISVLGVDYGREFVLTREYLDPSSKGQLLKRAMEAKINALTKAHLTPRSRRSST